MKFEEIMDLIGKKDLPGKDKLLNNIKENSSKVEKLIDEMPEEVVEKFLEEQGEIVDSIIRSMAFSYITVEETGSLVKPSIKIEFRENGKGNPIIEMTSVMVGGE
jgi:hypothetical protein